MVYLGKNTKLNNWCLSIQFYLYAFWPLFDILLPAPYLNFHLYNICEKNAHKGKLKVVLWAVNIHYGKQQPYQLCHCKSHFIVISLILRYLTKKSLFVCHLLTDHSFSTGRGLFMLESSSSVPLVPAKVVHFVSGLPTRFSEGMIYIGYLCHWTDSMG